MGADVDEGGEPACLLPLVCPACDRVQDDPATPVCERCGGRLRVDTASPH